MTGPPAPPLRDLTEPASEADSEDEFLAQARLHVTMLAQLLLTHAWLSCCCEPFFKPLNVNKMGACMPMQIIQILTVMSVTWKCRLRIYPLICV